MNINTIKLMLVEDHKLIRVGVRTLFEESQGFEVVAEAETGKDAVNKALQYNPDIIMLDIMLPDMSGLKVIKAIQDEDINSKIIILSSDNNIEDILKALSLGVYAYIIKDVNTDILTYIVKTVNDGAIWLDPKIVPLLREKSDKIIPQKKLY